MTDHASLCIKWIAINGYSMKGYAQCDAIINELCSLNLLLVNPSFKEIPFERDVLGHCDKIRRDFSLTPAGILLAEGLRE